jgi:N-acetylglucosamine kinase-like BadF-type ATPase
MPSPILAAIDAGQSSTRVVATDASGRPLRRGSAAGVGPLAASGSSRRTVAVIEDAYRQVMDKDRDADVLAIGLSGWSSDRSLDERLLDSVVRRIATRRTIMTSDGVTAYLGAAGARPGVVVAAGTGVIAVAADGRGGWATADGLGHALGDRGGGFWIAREGLWLAMSRTDGKAASVLRDRATARFGPLEHVADAFHRRDDRVSWIAGFTQDLAVLAVEDAAVARIWADAGGRLAASACIAADHVHRAGSPVSIVLTGGLASAELLLVPTMRSRLARERPGSTVRTTTDGPLKGTIRLARDERLAGWFPGGVLEHRAR